MQFGVCGDPLIARLAAEAGFDYAEWSVGPLLNPREPEQVFLSALEGSRSAGLPYPALNVLVPGDLKITGAEVDAAALCQYVATTFERAERAGVETLVFGSGAARQIPDGFDNGVAQVQLVDFCSMLAPVALNHGVTVVVEPLNRQDCNVLNSVAECAALVREVAHPGLRLLVDGYHFMRDGDSYEDIVANGDLLHHAHIATIPGRLAPGAEPCDFAPFFEALIRAGFDGRLSIEAILKSPEEELPTALTVLRDLVESARRTIG